MIHRIYIDKGIFNIIYILPQVFYSIIICSAFLIIIRRLSLTQQNAMKIKHERNKQNFNTIISKALKSIYILNLNFFLLFALLF